MAQPHVHSTCCDSTSSSDKSLSALPLARMLLLQIISTRDVLPTAASPATKTRMAEDPVPSAARPMNLQGLCARLQTKTHANGLCSRPRTKTHANWQNRMRNDPTGIDIAWAQIA